MKFIKNKDADRLRGSVLLILLMQMSGFFCVFMMPLSAFIRDKGTQLRVDMQLCFAYEKRFSNDAAFI